MRTPDGRECKYYYADFHRGRNVQACRLIERNPDSRPWKPSLCATCPVPDILLANSCEYLKLDGQVANRFFGFKQQVKVEGWCSQYFVEVPEPKLGCDRCKNRPSIFDLEEGPDSSP